MHGLSWHPGRLHPLHGREHCRVKSFDVAIPGQVRFCMPRGTLDDLLARAQLIEIRRDATPETGNRALRAARKNVGKLVQVQLSKLLRCRRLPNRSPLRRRPLRNSATGLAKRYFGWLV